jgi:hypothetical protein
MYINKKASTRLSKMGMTWGIGPLYCIKKCCVLKLIHFSVIATQLHKTEYIYDEFISMKYMLCEYTPEVT